MSDTTRLLLRALLGVLLVAVVVAGATEMRRYYVDRRSALEEISIQIAALGAVAADIPALQLRRAALADAATTGNAVDSRPVDVVKAGRTIGGLAESSGVLVQRLSPQDTGLSVSITGAVGGLLLVLEGLYRDHRELNVDAITLDAYRLPGMAGLTVTVSYENAVSQ